MLCIRTASAVVVTFALEWTEDFEGCDHDFHQTINKNHGSIETRCCWIIGALSTSDTWHPQVTDPTCTATS